MSRTSKSPRKVIREAYLVARDALPDHAHRFSPQKFTQPQLFAVLALKEFLRCDYRKIVETLRDSPGWCRDIGLESVPHFTTIQKAARRLLKLSKARLLLRATLQSAIKKTPTTAAA